jgi:ribosomal protein S18 acetylase RimI-like enzyme
VAVHVEAVPAAATYGLRRTVLRDGRADVDVAFPEDDRPGAFHLGAFSDGRLVAVGTFSPEPTTLRPGRRAVRLRAMAVAPEYQGRGLGELLLIALIDKAIELNALCLTLEVRVSNYVAQSLYRKYTFRETGLRRRYYSDNGEDAHIMTTEDLDTPHFQEVLAANRRALHERLTVDE